MRVFEEVIVLALIFWLEGIFPWFQGRKGRIHHALPNISMGIMNALVVSLLFSSFILAVIRWSEANSFGIIRWIPGPSWFLGILGFLLFDLWMYGWHYANHNISFLWRFHRVHHADHMLDATTALRFHLGEMIFSSVLRLAIIPLIGLSWIELLIYELCLNPIIIFHHSNVALPEKYDRILRAVIVTPNFHRVHHSQVVSETNSNYSSIFSWWDRLTRTFRKRQDTHTLNYGLSYLPEAQWQGFQGMLKLPFIKGEPYGPREEIRL